MLCLFTYIFVLHNNFKIKNHYDNDECQLSFHTTNSSDVELFLS